jgi:hypothetical protein
MQNIGERDAYDICRYIKFSDKINRQCYGIGLLFELDSLSKRYIQVLVRLLDETEVEKQWQITERDEAMFSMSPYVCSKQSSYSIVTYILNFNIAVFLITDI